MTSKKVICYYSSWAIYRQGNGAFNANNIDPNLCTHLIYAFIKIGADGSVTVNESNDYNNINQFNALKNQNQRLRTIAAIGGVNEGSRNFSTVANNPSIRNKFVGNVIAFLRQYNFNGLDLDWEYPTQGEGGSPSDKIAFTHLIRELKSEFCKYGYSLSAAIPAGQWLIQTTYDIAALRNYLDFINVMTYDYHSSWELTGHNAPLYGRPSYGGDTSLNVDSSIQFLICNGVPREKLILGVPSYGRTWALHGSSGKEVGAPARGPGGKGPFTATSGSLGYNEICSLIANQGWISRWDEQQQVPYAYSADQWVSYDNPRSVALKAQYARQQGLGGVMMWTIDTDDFRGLSSEETFPLLKAIKRNLY